MIVNEDYGIFSVILVKFYKLMRDPYILMKTYPSSLNTVKDLLNLFVPLLYKTPKPLSLKFYSKNVVLSRSFKLEKFVSAISRLRS